MQSSRRFSAWELVQFAAACLSLAGASLAVRLLPFRTLVRTMGWSRAARGGPPGRADEIMVAMRRAVARAPWRTACFDQGLAAHWLLRWRGVPSILHYGIDPGDGELSAHVWVSVEGRILIGEEEAGRHTQVASFPAEARGSGKG